jgi:hypothetical protein
MVTNRPSLSSDSCLIRNDKSVVISALGIDLGRIGAQTGNYLRVHRGCARILDILHNERTETRRGRVDLNHRRPGPEPASKKSLSHRPGVSYGI